MREVICVDCDIEVSCYEKFPESYQPRLHRLNRIIGYVAALASQTQSAQEVLNQVNGLHDHKGELTIYWKSPPSNREKELFIKAWESYIGDGGGLVSHIVGINNG